MSISVKQCTVKFQNKNNKNNVKLNLLKVKYNGKEFHLILQFA